MHQKPLIRIKMFTALNFHTENSSCDMVLHLRQQRQHSLGLWCPHSRRRGRWCGGRMLMVSVWGLWGAAGILGRGYGLLLARCGVRVAGRHHGRGHRLLGRANTLKKQERKEWEILVGLVLIQWIKLNAGVQVSYVISAACCHHLLHCCRHCNHTDWRPIGPASCWDSGPGL